MLAGANADRTSSTASLPGRHRGCVRRLIRNMIVEDAQARMILAQSLRYTSSSYSLVRDAAAADGELDAEILDRGGRNILDVLVEDDEIGQEARPQATEPILREGGVRAVPGIAREGFLEGLSLRRQAFGPGLAGDGGLDGEQRVDRRYGPVAGEAHPSTGLAQRAPGEGEGMASGA